MTQKYSPGKCVQKCIPIPGKWYLPVSQAAPGRAGTEKKTVGQICLNHEAVLGSQTLL